MFEDKAIFIDNGCVIESVQATAPGPAFHYASGRIRDVFHHACAAGRGLSSTARLGRSRTAWRGSSMIPASRSADLSLDVDISGVTLRAFVST